MTTTTSDFAGLTGRVVEPGDAGYLLASVGWNLLFPHQPALIVFAQETQDVVNALDWACRHEVDLRVRSGGHALEGWSSVDGGIVIDVSELKSVNIDAASNTAVVGAGLNQLEAVAALGECDVAAPTGTEGTVGLVGATLGGGFGLLTRAFGMASDNLLAVEIVLASSTGGAKAVIADEDDNADLLWALRGAGNGTLGIVTSLTYRIHPLSEVTYVTATWPGMDDLRVVFDAWQRSAPHTDNRLTSQLEVNRQETTLLGVLAGGSDAEAMQLLAPILSVGRPVVSMTTGGWADTYAAFQTPMTEEPANSKFVSQFIREPFPTEAIDLVASFVAKAPTSGCGYFTNAFGGIVRGSEPYGGSAFAHRSALFYAEPGAGWGVRDGGITSEADPLTAPCLAWVADFALALEPYVKGAYVNVPNADATDWETDYWGVNVERLRAIKAKYDPDDVFRFEQSIPPASEKMGQVRR